MRQIIYAVLTVCLFFGATLGSRAEDSDFRIRGGDVLQVTVWKEEGLDHELVVLPDGSITFPLIGTVSLQNLTTIESQNLIKEKLKNSIPDASVTVMVKAPLGHTVSVLGQVVKPGDIVIGRKTNVMQALSQAGGLTPYADEGDIVVLRNVNGEKTKIEYPYNDIVRGRNFDKDIELVPGDVVFIPSAGLF